MMKEYHVLRILFVAVMSTSSSARIENCPPLPLCASLHHNTGEQALSFAFPPITAVQRHAPHQVPHQNLETQRQIYIGQHI